MAINVKLGNRGNLANCRLGSFAARSPQKWPEPAKGGSLDRLPSLFSTPNCPTTNHLHSAESFGEEHETAEKLMASEAKSKPDNCSKEWTKKNWAWVRQPRPNEKSSEMWETATK